jgi:hypothetical protein
LPHLSARKKVSQRLLKPLRLADSSEFGTFPTAPPQTGRATFISIRLSSFQWPSSSLMLEHRRIPRRSLVYPLYNLFPFATYQAFPGSDYYGNSVAMNLSVFRRSRIPVSETFSA